MRILLAEDDIETAEFVARGLDELGHNVVRADTGVDALHLATTEPFDLILLDRMLPEMDGIAVLRRLRAAKIELPVLILTALGLIEDRVEGLEAGADDYLVKPFAFSELAARVNALARRGPINAPLTKLECDGLSAKITRTGAIYSDRGRYRADVNYVGIGEELARKVRARLKEWR